MHDTMPATHNGQAMASEVNQECLALGACQCGLQCLACGWSKCICNSKWSKDSWPHSKDYDDAHLELAKRFRHLDRIVDKISKAVAGMDLVRYGFPSQRRACLGAAHNG
jgi:hypothetical protein